MFMAMVVFMLRGCACAKGEDAAGADRVVVGGVGGGAAGEGNGGPAETGVEEGEDEGDEKHMHL